MLSVNNLCAFVCLLLILSQFAIIFCYSYQQLIVNCFLVFVKHKLFGSKIKLTHFCCITKQTVVIFYADSNKCICLENLSTGFKKAFFVGSKLVRQFFLCGLLHTTLLYYFHLFSTVQTETKSFIFRVLKQWRPPKKSNVFQALPNGNDAIFNTVASKTTISPTRSTQNSRAEGFRSSCGS